MAGAYRTDRYEVPQDGKHLIVVLLASVQHHLHHQHHVVHE